MEGPQRLPQWPQADALGVNYHRAPSAWLDWRLGHSSTPQVRAFGCWALDTVGSWGTYPGPSGGRALWGGRRGVAARRRAEAMGSASQGPVAPEATFPSLHTVRRRLAAGLPLATTRRRCAQARPKPTRGFRGAVRGSVEEEGQEGFPARRPPAAARGRARRQEAPPRRRAAGGAEAETGRFARELPRYPLG